MRKIYKVINRKKPSKYEVLSTAGICTAICGLLIFGTMSCLIFSDKMKDYAKNNCDFLSKDDVTNDIKETYSEDKIAHLKDQVSNEYKNLINMINSNKTIIEGNDKLSMRIEAEYSDYSNCSSIKRDYSETDLISIATSYYTMEINILSQELNQYELQLDKNLITMDVFNKNHKEINQQITDYQTIIDDLGKEYVNLYGKTKVLS